MSRDEFIIQGRWVYNSGPELLETLRDHTAEFLLKATRRVLSRADDALFAFAQQASAEARNEQLDAMRRLRQLRLPLERAMTQQAESNFGRLRGPVEPSAIDNTLSLVDDAEVDLDRMVDACALAILGVHGPALDAIERRFAVLRGVRVLDPADNPLSARQLAAALKAAQAELSLPSLVRELLYPLYQEDLVSSLAPLLTELNARLIGAGILPELGNPRPIEVPDGDAAVAEVARDAAANDAPIAALAPTVAMDDEQFNALCEMLHAFRPQQAELETEAAPEAAVAAIRPYASDEILSVLTLLQPQVPDSVRSALECRQLPLAALLKQELIAAAGRIGLPTEQLQISTADEDAVELVAMLFDVMFDERDFEEPARAQLSRLVVPFVKAALVDRSLFQSRSHPARRLLSAVAEACEGNRGDGPQERELLRKTEQTIDRLVGDFNEDVAIFDTLEHELRAYLDQNSQRIAQAERRAAEAQRGQERLAQAREFAQRELAQRRGEQALPPVLDEFLDRYWTHHLSMIALREGVHTPAWQMAVGVAERLLGLLPADASEVAGVMAQLRAPIAGVLGSSGVTGEAAERLQSALGHSLEAMARGRFARVAPSVKLVAANPQPVESSQTPALRPELAVAADRNEAAPAESHLQFVRRLPIGAWVQIPDDDGHPQAVKLSWISPITSRLMFVNRRGVRVLVASYEELAQMRADGKLNLHDPEHVFDRMMGQVIDRLQTGNAS